MSKFQGRSLEIGIAGTSPAMTRGVGDKDRVLLTAGSDQ